MNNTNTQEISGTQFRIGQRVLVTEFARPYKRIAATITGYRDSGWMVKYDMKQNGQIGGWHFADEILPMRKVAR